MGDPRTSSRANFTPAPAAAARCAASSPSATRSSRSSPSRARRPRYSTKCAAISQRDSRTPDRAFEHVPLKTSFRSAPGVLGAVDEVFLAPAHQRGLVSDDLWMRSRGAEARTCRALVEIWAPVSAAEAPEANDDRLATAARSRRRERSRRASRAARRREDRRAASRPRPANCVDSKAERFRPIRAARHSDPGARARRLFRRRSSAR